MKTIECPECGRFLKPCRSQFPTHSTEPIGPECWMSRQPITAQHREWSQQAERAQRVLLLAYRLRTEDPAQVCREVGRTDAGELQQLLLTALAAVPAHLPPSQVFGWLRGLQAQGASA